MGEGKTESFEEGFLWFESKMQELRFDRVERVLGQEKGSIQNWKWIKPRKGKGGAVHYVFIWPKTGHMVVVRTVAAPDGKVPIPSKRGWVLIVPISNPDKRAYCFSPVNRGNNFWKILYEKTLVAREIVIQIPRCVECHAKTKIEIDRTTGYIGDRCFVCTKDVLHPWIHWNAIQHSLVAWRRIRADRSAEKRNRKNPNIKVPGSARLIRNLWRKVLPDGRVVTV